MVNFNRNIVPGSGILLAPAGRGLRYGDGLFETVRVVEGHLPFWEKHWARLRQGFRVLRFEVPAHFTEAFFQNEIARLTGEQGNHRLRLTVWRSGEGLYTPKPSAGPVFLIETAGLRGASFRPNELGLHLGICPEVHLPTAKNASAERYCLPNLKTCSALPFVLAGIWKKENGLDDCLLLNTAGRIACGGSSNVFLWKNGSLFTPALTEGCVAGTMRAVVLDLAKTLEINVLETMVREVDLQEADEIMLTNAISGIRWVRKIKGVDKEFSDEQSGLLLAELNLCLSRLSTGTWRRHR